MGIGSCCNIRISLGMQFSFHTDVCIIFRVRIRRRYRRNIAAVFDIHKFDSRR